MGIEKKSFSFRLSEETVEQLRCYAEEENRSLSNMVETILLQYIKSRNTPPEG